MCGHAFVRGSGRDRSSALGVVDPHKVSCSEARRCYDHLLVSNMLNSRRSYVMVTVDSGEKRADARGNKADTGLFLWLLAVGLALSTHLLLLVRILQSRLQRMCMPAAPASPRSTRLPISSPRRSSAHSALSPPLTPHLPSKEPAERNLRTAMAGQFRLHVEKKHDNYPARCDFVDAWAEAVSTSPLSFLVLCR